MRVGDFLLARFKEELAAATATLMDEDFDDPVNYEALQLRSHAQSAIQIVEWHAKWPVLLEGPTTIEPANPVTDYTEQINSYVISMSKQIAWATQEEFVKRFGREPATAPILRIMVMPYQAHPDFDPEWVS